MHVEANAAGQQLAVLDRQPSDGHGAQLRGVGRDLERLRGDAAGVEAVLDCAELPLVDHVVRRDAADVVARERRDLRQQFGLGD
jgi:hypothetical protein